MVGSSSFRIFAFAGLLLLILPSPSHAKWAGSLPPFYVCGRSEILRHLTSEGQVDWEYHSDDPLVSVEAQPSGDVLVAGGKSGVFLLKRTDRGFQVVWDWGSLGLGNIVDAVAVERELDGRPSLVLAVDATSGACRLFFAEARSTAVKIRWQMPLSGTPMRARICPDNRNILVVMDRPEGLGGSEIPLIMEVDFREDKTIWSLDVKDGLADPRDAVRGLDGSTLVADAGRGSILCFDRSKRLKWERSLNTKTQSVSPQAFSLSPFQYRSGEYLLVLAGFHENGKNQRSGGRPVSPVFDRIFLLDPDDGAILSEQTLPKTSYTPWISRVSADGVALKKRKGKP